MKFSGRCNGVPWRRGFSFFGALVLGMAAIILSPRAAMGQDNRPATPLTNSDYRLDVNDLIDFSVYQEPDLDAVIRISGDGNAIFPLIGTVQIAHKTVGEATDIIRKRYMDGYLVNPQVTLTVRSYAKKVYTVLGQVKNAGSYEIEGSEDISLLQAIGTAGGYTRIANPSSITVKRREGGKEIVLHFDAKKMAKSDADTGFSVKPGDVITVGESIF